jgi:hypothetical protein
VDALPELPVAAGQQVADVWHVGYLLVDGQALSARDERVERKGGHHEAYPREPRRAWAASWWDWIELGEDDDGGGDEENGGRRDGLQALNG